VGGCAAGWLIFVFSGRGVGFMYYLDLSTESIYGEAVPFLVAVHSGFKDDRT